MIRHSALAFALLMGSASIAQQKALTDQVIWGTPTFSAKFVGGLASMKDGLHYTVQEEQDGKDVINEYNYKDGKKVATLVDLSALVPAGSKDPIAVEGYTFSGDEQKLLFEVGHEQIYRYSYYTYFYVYDRTTKALTPLSDMAKSKQRLATFSPDGGKVAFVRDNNLFIVDLKTMTETAVTKDGERNHVINGGTDWVYEEEFTLVQGFAWSPLGTKLLYLRSDESAVKEYDLTTYKESLYPGEYRFKYPKAGETNSTVSLFMFDTRGNTTVQVPLPDSNGDIYVPRLGWTNDDATVWYMHMDRLQQTKDIYTLNIPMVRPVQATMQPKRVYHETSPTYIETTDDLFWMSDGSGFIITNEQDGWNHIVWNSMDGKTSRVITTGNYDVTGVKGIDEKNKRVIYTASRMNPTQQEVWSIGLDGKTEKQLSPLGGMNDAEFSTGFKYFINTRSTQNTPPVMTLHDGTGKLIKTLEDNAGLKAALAEYGWRPVEFFQLTTDAGVTLNAWKITPPNFDPLKKYPVLMSQYSGPNSNETTDDFGGRNMLWHQLLAQKGYVVVCVDPRGTGRRGRDFRHMTYGQLGKYETEDQIASAKWLGRQPWCDAARIGIWGWSYGGYMSSLCITKGADVFKMAIAVAPVVNWRFYDSIYTERYMGLPKENASGYDDNSPINHVSELKGKYFLIHGLADDNVHFQNSAEMINALVKANKQFDLFTYPDKNHGIYGGNTRLHLFDMLTNYVLENL